MDLWCRLTLLILIQICVAQEAIETTTAASIDVCLLPKESGPCFGYNLNWYYNPETRKCEEFIYGGCHGNRNRFSHKDACIRVCIKKTDCPKMVLPMLPKNCRYDKSLKNDGCPKNEVECDVKPGKCPSDFNQTDPYSCIFDCANDDWCGDNEKCCEIGCNSICLLADPDDDNDTSSSSSNYSSYNISYTTVQTTISNDDEDNEEGMKERENDFENNEIKK